MNRKIKKANIKDIAKEAGVAISTVSFVINKSKPVKKKTRDKVIAAIKKLNYQPSNYARGLRTKTTKTVGVIVPDITSPFFSQVVNGMEEVARQRGYNIVLICTFFNIQEEISQVNNLIRNYVDGLIFLNGYDNKNFLKDLKKQEVPFVLVDREVDDPAVPSVLINNEKAMEELVSYISRKNHSKIGYITMPVENITIAKKRYSGYLKGLKKNKLAFDSNIVMIDSVKKVSSFFISYDAIKEFMSKKELPSAFITFSDYNAYMLIRILKDLGYAIPQDISVAGFGNLIFNSFVEPTLTTVNLPKKELGSTGMELLLEIIEGRRSTPNKIYLPTRVIERNSVITYKDSKK